MEYRNLEFTARRMVLILLALLVLGGTGGCATSFIYERADRVANRWIDGYVELDAAQQEVLDRGLAELHAWHRREQLPAYAGWLRGAAARLGTEAPFAADELRTLGAELGLFWRELAGAGLPLLAEIGAGLSGEQVAGLLATLREEHATESEAAAGRTAAWHQQRRARSMERLMRRFTGRMSAAQRTAILTWSVSLEPSQSAAFGNRAGWIDELETALALRGDAAALHASAERLFVAPVQRWDPDYAALVERNAARTTLFLAGFLANLEQRQRERAAEQLERLAVQLERLADPDG